MANVTRFETGYSNLPVEAPPPVSQQGPRATLRRRFRSATPGHAAALLLIGGVALIGTTIAWLIANR